MVFVMKKCLAMLIPFTLFGCAYNGLLDMNDDGYEYYSEVMSFSERCFQLGKVSPELMSDTTHNLGVVLSIVNYDRNRLNAMYKEKLQRLSYSTNVNCSATEVGMRNVIAHGERIQRNQEAQASRPQINTYSPPPRPVYCNQIGTMTLCN
jgi:hypothetical protein